MQSQSRRRPVSLALRNTLAAALVAGTAALPVPAQAIRFWGEEDETPAAEKPAAPAAPGEQAPLVTGLPNFADLVEALRPSVVTISTSAASSPQMSMGPRGPRQFGPPGQDPFQQFMEPFERYFGPMPRQPKQRSLGSGFILDRNGLIITNNHVVEGADEILVRTAADKEYKAKIVGRDSKTDLAVIKIDAGSDELKPVVLGNSDELRVGDWVFAIGNPFGLSDTVTAGIVSAKSRYIGQGSYDDFIQTDAAINPGNSGGPLVNIKGQVVGINSAIFSRAGGNIGIGFAIPINLAKELVPQLQEKGRVTRGWLGVYIQRVTPDIAESLKLEKPRGALVADVMQDSPAAEAGIEVGDVIVEFDGHPIKESTDLPLVVARTPIGKQAEVKIIRNGKAQTLTVKIDVLKDEEVAVGSAEGGFGLAVQDLTPEIAESLGIDPKTQGVVVSGVEPGSPADEAGLQRGDVLLEINRQPVENETAYAKAIKKMEKGKTVLLLVRRGENTIFMTLRTQKEQ